MRLPFQKRPESERRPREPAGIDVDDAVATARTVARRRLIGAFVLLVLGVVGFPMLFETRPRPLPANVPIITAQNERARMATPNARERLQGASAAGAVEPSVAVAAPVAPPVAPPVATHVAVPAAAPAAASAAASAVTLPALPGPGAATSPTASGTSPRTATTPASVAKPPPPVAPTAPAATAGDAPPREPARRSEHSATPRPAPAPAPVKPPPPVEVHEEGRFVVQVGAYSDAGTLRDTRQKVEKLGLKTYTQVIESDGGKRTRVRVGPFATRAEAQAAAAKLKAAGLPANLIAL